MTSSYFSEPEDHLDPHLFEGTRLREDIAANLLDRLYGGLRSLGLRSPDEWVFAWLAGSGVSYQWSADRGNGDLDVLFGVDYPEFLNCNPHFPRLGRVEVAAYVDDMLKTTLWPKTAHYSIHGQVYEVTFFWNPLVSTTDVSVIHPYAAYNLLSGQWDVAPERHPAHVHPESWDRIADLDMQQAQEIESLWHSGPTGAIHARSAARSMWNTIHAGRRDAFSDTGLGYGDIHNFRWQAAKRAGAVDILRSVVNDADDYDRAQQEKLYGSPLAAPTDIITRAALRYARPNYIGRGHG
jgi:hypothetical protein